jgi:hypothetical protein
MAPSKQPSAQGPAGDAPPLPPSAHVPYVPLVSRRAQEKSERALGPGEITAYRSHRDRHYPRWSGFGRDLDPGERAQCNAYHDGRRRTRRNETLAPGRLWHRVKRLDVRDYKGDDVRPEPAPKQGFTMRVKHPEEKKHYWTRPTRWRDGQGCGIPKFALHSNMLTSAESRVLCILWDCKSHWHWHVEGDAYVSGYTQASIGAKIGSGQGRTSSVTDGERAVLSKVDAPETPWAEGAFRESLSGRDAEALDFLLERGFVEEQSDGGGGGLHLTGKGRAELSGERQVGIDHSYVSRIVSSLDEKGFLTFNRGGDGAPGEYYLSCQEKAGWTYAALDPHSARARLVKMTDHTDSSDEIDWQWALTTTEKPSSASARRARARRIRKVQKDLEEVGRLKRAEQRRGDPTAGGRSFTTGEAIDHALKDLLGMEDGDEISESRAEAITKGLADYERQKQQREDERRRQAERERKAQEQQEQEKNESERERKKRLRERRDELERQARLLEENGGLPPPDE